jgi:hypothetical protein
MRDDQLTGFLWGEVVTEKRGHRALKAKLMIPKPDHEGFVRRREISVMEPLAKYAERELTEVVRI